MRVRAAGSDTPYQDVRVAARSALQAEAILRRRGVEVQIENARLVGDAPDGTLPVAARGQLSCLDCGYHLDGLTVQDSIIVCPECGSPQLLAVIEPDKALSIPSNLNTGIFSRNMGSFMAGCFVGVVGLIALIALLSANL